MIARKPQFGVAVAAAIHNVERVMHRLYPTLYTIFSTLYTVLFGVGVIER